MVFGKHSRKPTKVNNDGQALPMVMHTKFLGIWIDSQLNWQKHFDQLCLKIICNTQLLRISKKQLSMCTKNLIYYAHIYSHLVYGVTTWGNMLSKEHLSKLQRLQNCCFGLITGKTASIEDYKSLKIMRIPDIIKLQNLKLGFKVQYSQLPSMVMNACTTNAKQVLLKKDTIITLDRKMNQIITNLRVVGTKTVS